MKTKLMIAMAAFMLISMTAHTQDVEIDNRTQMHAGLKAGLNFANVYDESTDQFNSNGKTGFVGGIFLRIPLGKYFGIQPELLYSRKGFKGEGIFLDNPYNFTRTTSYIDIPLQIAVKPAEFITILGGPQYSYLIKQTDDFSNTTISSSQEQDFDNINIRKNVLGFIGGVDVNVNNFVIGTRMGFDISKNHGDGTSSTPRYKNAWVQATIGYIL